MNLYTVMFVGLATCFPCILADQQPNISSFNDTDDVISGTDKDEHINCTFDDVIGFDEEVFPDKGVNTSIENMCNGTIEEFDDSKTVKDNQSSQEPRFDPFNQGLISRSQFMKGEHICRYLYYPLFCSAVILNVFNIIVFTDPSMRTPTNTYLVALSGCELIFAFLSSFRPLLKLVYGDDAPTKQVYLIFAMYNSSFLLGVFRRLMYCFTVLVSVERFLAVAFPLKARNFRLIKSPAIFIFVFAIFCFVCHIPLALKFLVVPKPNSTDYTITPSQISIQHGDVIADILMFNRIFFTYFTLLVGLLMNLFVLVALKRHSNNRKKMNTSVDAEKAARAERQTTITILVSTFLFTVLAIPLATDALMSELFKEYNLYRREHYTSLLMKDVNNVLIMFSLSTDFVFYMLLSKTYRRVFMRRIPFVATVCRRKAYVKEVSKTQVTETEGM